MKKNLRMLLLTVLGCWMAGSAWAEDHYLVGGCTASGWESGDWQRSPVAMVNVADNVWVWAGKLTVGDGDNGRFKIPNSGGGWDGYWAPEQGTVLGTEEKDLSTSSEGDNKYCVAEEGIYKVTINTSSLKIKAEKLTEPSKDGDYYLISSVADYYWFAGKVTSEGGALKARLTADLNFAEAGFFPLACDKFKFKGEFDGAGHTISNAVIIGSNNNVAFARYASDGANIHDFVIEGSFTGNAKVGGIIGFARDGGEVKLANIINKASVQATGNTDANAAALVGCATDGTKITALNCANLGSVSGQDGQCAAFAGWTQSGTTFTNCWNNGTINNIDGTSQLYRNSGSVTAVNCYDLTGNEGYNQGEKLAASTLTTGELCYKLNGDQSVIGWRQNLTGDDADQIPVPFSSHAQVYANGTLKCDGTSAGGELTYANESSSVIPPHSYENGWCSVCGAFDKEYLTADEDGFFSIGTANDLHWFATFVDKENQAAKAKLTANIDYSEFKQGFIGGSQAAAFSGVFDGQGKTITIDIVNDGTNRTGLFAYIKSATIKNLAVEGSATSAGNNCVGGLGGRSDGDGTLIENVVVKTAVSYTGSNGDATCGGFFANMEAKVTLRNCAFYGSINTGTSEGNGGLVGWAGGGTNSVYENCIVAPTSYTKNGNSADFARNNPTTTNCVKLEGDDARLATGEMTYILNGNQSENVTWYQKLGAEGDAHPMPFGTEIVYANGSLDCAGNAKEGTTVTYSNTDGSTRDEHQFTDGFCSACGQVDLNYIAATDGVYNLASAKDVKWFAAFVNSGNGAANACLTADIDFDGVSFTGIGNGANHYTGTFDGQRHIVKNMTIDLPEVANVGFFNEIGDGVVIKNFTIDASCSVKGEKFAGAFVGHASGNGTALLAQLGNEGSVETVNQNAGAIVGCNTSGELKLTIKNCYNAGAIKSANEAGGLSGWFGNDAITENCYNMGTVTSGESYARGNNIQITNCFDAVTSWPALNKVNIEDFTNGVVYAKLAEAAPYVWFLSAAEGGHPVLYATEWQTVIVKSDYAGNEIADGDFFIYNPTSGLWLQNNDKNTGDWNTRGATGDYGFEFGISAIDGGYKLDPKFGHNHSFNISNFYLDTNDAVSAWKLEKLNTQDGVVAYQIKADDGRVLSLNNDNNLDWNTGRAAEWQLVTKADRIKFMKENASEENPIDATFLISDPRFANENERAAAWNWDMNLDGGARDDVRWYRNRRSYAIWNSKSFKLTQVIANVPNGQYKLTLKGYYRDGDKDQVVARRQAGEERILANYFINEDKAPMMSILDGASENWVEGLFFYPAADATAPYGHYPDNADGFNRIFQDYPNSYLNAGVTSQVTTGQMTIGLEKLEKNEKDWLAFDDFSLVYMGNSMGLEEYLNALRTAIEAAEAFDATTTSTALAGALADALSDAKAKLTSVEEGEIETATANLNAALNAAKAVNIVALKATADLAKTEVDADALASVSNYLNDATTAAETAIAEATTAGAIEQALYDLTAARKINALSTTATYKGSTPAAGKVYLFNVGTGMFMGTGSDWNTHAAVDQVGIEFELVDLANPEVNNFKFKTGRGGGWMAYNGYVDTGSQDIWHFLPVAGKEGVYNISSTGNDGYLLGYNPNKGTDGKNYWNNIGIDQTGLDNPMNQWIIVTPAERTAMIEDASEENPVDVSYLIKNASLNRQDGYDMWNKQCTGGNGGARVSTTTDGNGDRAADYAYEFFEPENFSFTQSLEGLKAGKYVVAVQGFFRNGNGDAQRDAFNAGEEAVQLAYLMANDEKEFLPNITEELDLVPALTDVIKSDKGAFPNMPNAAIEYFQHGAYWTTVEVEVEEDGKLTLGVKKDERQQVGDWTVIDNFRLIYMGEIEKVDSALLAAKDSLAALIATAKAIDTTGKTSESATALSNAITDAETALAAETATVESLNAAKTALQNAIDGLKDEVVDGINVIEAAAKAGKVYNTQGQKVNKTQKGVYIINGKKTVVK